MTRLDALRALLAQPDPPDLKTADGVTRGRREVTDDAPKPKSIAEWLARYGRRAS